MIIERFKTNFARNIFKQKYAQGPEDTWDALASRLIEDVCGTRWGSERSILSKEDRGQLEEYIKEFKFVPGGRYLYYAGRPFKAYNNCYLLRAEEDTREEWSALTWRAMSCLMTGGGIGIDYCLTPETPVLCKDLTWKQVHTLRPGQEIIAFHEDLNLQKAATTTATVTSTGLIQSECFQITTQYGSINTSFNHKFVVRKPGTHKKKGSGYNWVEAKDITSGDEIAFSIEPWIQQDNSELGWLGGLFDGEGWLSQSQGKLTCGFAQRPGLVLERGKQLLDKYKIKYCISTSINSDVVSILLSGKWNILKLLSLAKPIRLLEKAGDFWEGKKLSTKVAKPAIVESNTSIGLRTVVALSTSTGTLISGGYYSHNTRLRPEGRPLLRTGGISSGPIPLMFCINEIGRNVMQGGSRRSAIYASLNWQHEDVTKFLSVKNWNATTQALKNIDFNHSAPLDMTNISVNYDDAWKFDPNNPIFFENCKQAMRTGEPGFSFNFGEKENETLRNAPVSSSTRVLLQEGYESIENIVGKEVSIWTGKQWAKTTFVKTKSDITTLKVQMSNGRSISADPDHPFLIWTKEGVTRVPAKELKQGMSLVTELPQEAIPYTEDNYGYGFVFGDGSIRNYRGDISYHVEEKKSCFERTMEVLSGYTRSLPNRGYFESNSQSKQFIPDVGFVAGWFDADGSYTRGTLRLSCKDKSSLLELAEYLDSIGIYNTVRVDGKSGYYPKVLMHSLTILKKSHNRFAKLIPTYRLKIKTTGEIRAQNIKVLEVSPAITEDVFCCDVGVEEHSFLAEGVIIGNCTEVTSEDDSDVCNLGSINIGNINSLEEFKDVVSLASKFLVCGTLRADLPYKKVYQVREKNRRLGLGLMGIHEWLLKRGANYEVTQELKTWLEVYKNESERAANEHCERLFISKPVAYRAIAPTGTIGILAGTTTGIEPLFAVAYKRRYLTNGTKWKYEFVVDSTADLLIKEYGLNPDSIDTAYKLSHDYERRIKFQADIQDYVDMSISSTINLPQWGTKNNNEEQVRRFSEILAQYAPRLRGFTCYPDGSRGGQPLTEVSYEEAIKHHGVIFEENIDASCTSGVCGI